MPPARRIRRGCLESSTAITASKALDALNALTFAEWRGIPLNTAFTINAQGSAIFGSGRANKTNTDTFRTEIADTICAVARKFHIPFAYVITLENPPCGGPGLHAHVSAHGPQDDEHHARYRDALKAAFERRFCWASNRPEDHYTPIYIKPQRLGFLNAQGWLGYSLKGAEDMFAEAVRHAALPCPFHRDRFNYSSQGTIHGQRVTISHSIGATARKKKNYVDKATLADLFRAAREWHAALKERLRAHSETQQVPAHSATPAPSPDGIATAQPPGGCGAGAPASDRIGRHFGSARSPFTDLNVRSSFSSRQFGIHPSEHHERRKAIVMSTGPPSLDDIAADYLGDAEEFMRVVDRDRPTPPQRPPAAPATLVSTLRQPCAGFLGHFLERVLLDAQRAADEAAEAKDTL